MTKKVYIIITNYTQGWRHLIECLESVYRMDYPNYQVIVSDDCSEDDGLSNVKQWSLGNAEFNVSHTNSLRRFVASPVPKPIECIEFFDHDVIRPPAFPLTALLLIRSSLNRGYAGANNLGLKFALARSDFDYVWLLNNDTVVQPQALSELVKRMEERPDAGMCGSTLLYYHAPQVIQTLGGARFNKWTGIGRQLDKDRALSEAHDPEWIENKMDYVYGASLLVSNRFIEKVGLMSEDYFIYFEELDWVRRARGMFRLAYAPKSIVYHKAGVSIGGGYRPGSRGSTFSDYYYVRNTLRFTQRFHPWAMPTVYGRLALMLFQKIKGRQWVSASIILAILLGRQVDISRLRKTPSPDRQTPERMVQEPYRRGRD